MPVNKVNIFCYPFGSSSPFATFGFLSFIGCLSVLDAYFLVHALFSFISFVYLSYDISCLDKLLPRHINLKVKAF